MIIIVIASILIGLLVLRLAYIENQEGCVAPLFPEQKSRALIKAERLQKEFEEGVRVYAKKKDGLWYKGTSLGYHDWRLYTTFFLVKFDDDEILSLPSEDMRTL
jgi:hypothetical protein